MPRIVYKHVPKSSFVNHLPIFEGQIQRGRNCCLHSGNGSKAGPDVSLEISHCATPAATRILGWIRMSMCVCMSFTSSAYGCIAVQVFGSGVKLVLFMDTGITLRPCRCIATPLIDVSPIFIVPLALSLWPRHPLS